MKRSSTSTPDSPVAKKQKIATAEGEAATAAPEATAGGDGEWTRVERRKAKKAKKAAAIKDVCVRALCFRPRVCSWTTASRTRRRGLLTRRTRFRSENKLLG
jgi:hypothetical protein